MAELIVPWLKEIAAQQKKLLTIPEAADQLGFSPGKMYELMYKGGLASMQIPSKSGRRNTRRIEQAEVDAFIVRYRVQGGTTTGGVR